MPKNKVFIATSIDGFIADKNGGIEWLHSIPNPGGDDMGYSAFMEEVDALIMGRNTFETICSFNIEWPYFKPVYVLSTRMKTIPKEYQDKAFLVNGSLSSILEEIHGKGHKHLYIDGGKTIQSFLKEGLIDSLVITQIPILLGGGISLFGDLPSPQEFQCTETKRFLNSIVQNRFERKNIQE